MRVPNMKAGIALPGSILVPGKGSVLGPRQCTFDLSLNAERLLSLESTCSPYLGADHA